MWLAGLLQSTLQHLHHLIHLQTQKRGTICVRGDLGCTEKCVAGSGEKEAEQDIGGTRVSNEDDKSDKENARMKNPPQAAQILLKPQIRKLQLRAYHRFSS